MLQKLKSIVLKLKRKGSVQIVTAIAVLTATFLGYQNFMTLPAGGLPAGEYVLANGLIYYSNGQGHICSYVSKNVDFQRTSFIREIPAGNVDDGQCGGGGILAQGQYILPNGVEFFANGQGQSCNYSRIEYLGTATAITAVPPGNGYDPNIYCQGWDRTLSPGPYALSDGTTFYTNGTGDYCSYSTRIDLTNVPVLPSLSREMHRNLSNDGYCGGQGGRLVPGQYLLPNGVEFFSNGQGQSCNYSRIEYIANAIVIPSVPNDNGYDPTIYCQGWGETLTPGQYARSDGSTFYTNGTGDYCNYSVRIDMRNVPVLPSLPGQMHVNGYNEGYCGGQGGRLVPGQYVLPTGVEFFSNGQGGTCNYSRAEGFGNAISIPRVPDGNGYNPNGFCQGWEGGLALGHYLLPNHFAFFSNGQGHICYHGSALPEDFLPNLQYVTSIPPGNSNDGICGGREGVPFTQSFPTPTLSYLSATNIKPFVSPNLAKMVQPLLEGLKQNFITTAYRNTIGRPPTEAELQQSKDRLTQGVAKNYSDISGYARIAAQSAGQYSRRVGNSSILFHDPNRSKVVYSVPGNGILTNSHSQPTPGEHFVLSQSGDLDGDGQTDLIWYDTYTGQVIYWPSGDSARAKSPGTIVPTSGWMIAGVGDFNGDGKSDLVWYNIKDGGISLWWSGNDTMPTPNFVPPSSGWAINGIGDFDGDGKSDILWYNSHDGAVSIWWRGESSPATPYAVPPSTGWIISGIGDFDGDGKSDILWYNSPSGQLAVWPAANPNGYSPGAVGPNDSWKISDIGDYNGDHKSDILWRNLSHGDLVVWSSADSNQSYFTGNVDPNSGWDIKTNKSTGQVPRRYLTDGLTYSRDWSEVAKKLNEATSDGQMLGIGVREGLQMSMLNGTGLQDADYQADLVDPVTGNAVARISQSADIKYDNLPMPGVLSGGTPLDKSLICVLKDVAFQIYRGRSPLPLAPSPDSILHTNTTNVKVTYLYGAGASDLKSLAASSVIDAAQDLTQKLGLNIWPSGIDNSANNINLDTFNAKHSDNTADVTVQCDNNLGGTVGGNASVFDINGYTVRAKISMNCNAYSTREALTAAIEHELLHTFGIQHSSGEHIMNYVYAYKSLLNPVLPQGAKEVVQAQIGNANLTFDFLKNCTTTANYHLTTCKKDPLFEYKCASDKQAYENTTPPPPNFAPPVLASGSGPNCSSSYLSCPLGANFDPVYCQCLRTSATLIFNPSTYQSPGNNTGTFTNGGSYCQGDDECSD